MFLLSLQAFDVVEKSYFETIDDALAEKANLSNYHLPHNEVHTHTHTLCKAYWQIELEIEEGSSLLVAIETSKLGISVN